MHLPASRIAFSAALVGGIALALAARGADAPPRPLPPVPVSPTVPAPFPQAGHPVRVQNPLPGPAPVADGEGPGGAAPAEAGPELSLGECLAVAVECQPALRAARASQAATAAGVQALDRIGRLGEVLSPDLPFRKQQAQRGVIASAAEYQKTYNEVVQDVTRLYYTAVYARQQEKIADEVIRFVEAQLEIARETIRTAADLTKLGGLSLGKVLAAETELGKVRAERVNARVGSERALSALQERMGVDERTFPFRLRDVELPVMALTGNRPITRELVVAEALCRRPELALAAAGVDAFRLEVYAQGAVSLKRVVPTFASGADIHAKDIPPAMRGAEYRPGGVLIELPPQLVGTKEDRVARAMAFAQRAEAVYDSARGLVRAEAAEGYFQFEAATEKLRLAGDRLRSARELQQTSRDNAANVVDKTLLVQAELIASAAQSDYVRAVHEHLLALAALERITAGGICPDFPGRR